VNAPPPVPPQSVTKNSDLNPAFARALKGIWLFTWKSQLTWKRLPLLLLGFLALPVLIFITTPSPKTWAYSHRPQINEPDEDFNSFSRRLSRDNLRLTKTQKSGLQKIFFEEYERSQTILDSAPAPEGGTDRLSPEIEACHQRILERAKPVLDEKQMDRLDAFSPRDKSEGRRQFLDQVWERTTPFYRLLIDLYFFIVLPLNCVRMCGSVIRDELEADTLSFLTTRPLSRAKLLVIMFLSQTGWLQITMLIQTLLVFGTGWFREIPDLGSLFFLFLLAQIFAIWAWSGLGLFLGQVSKRFMALALLYGAVVEMGIGRIPTNINNLSLMVHLKTLLGKSDVLQNIYSWPAAGVAGAVGSLLFGAAIFLSLAAVMFTFKEYHRISETKK